MKGRMMHLIYYDNSIIVRTFVFDFVENVRLLAQALDSLVRRGWGRSTRSISSPSPPNPSGYRQPNDAMFRGATLRLDKQHTITIEEVLSRPRGLIGRGPWLLTGKVPDRANEVCVLKIARPAKTRLCEADLIAHARNLAGRNINQEWVLNHLPNLIWSDEDAPIDVHERVAQLFPEVYELRVLRLLLMDVLLPLSQAEASDLGSIFRDIFHCEPVF
jgi:hypothetical protein